MRNEEVINAYRVSRESYWYFLSRSSLSYCIGFSQYVTTHQ